MKIYPYILPSNEAFSEIVDMQDRPLMVIPHEQMLQNKISHRKVYVILCDQEGSILTLRSNKPQINLPNSSVFAGEAREHVALKVIKNVIRLTKDNPIEFHEYSLKQYKYDTFFIAKVNTEHKRTANSRMLWLDLDELQGFATHFTDMLNEKLLELINQGHLQSLTQNIKC